MNIYFDNAATTPIDKDVIELMYLTMKDKFGNPSSIHRYGREAKVLIEDSRKTIAEILNVSPSEIFFTSCGTEANNTVIYAVIKGLGIKSIITSPIEHHAITHTLAMFEKSGLIKVHFTKVNDKGQIDINHLEELLKSNENSFVTLMHANNEIGNLLPIKDVSGLCQENKALFHSDMVQTIGKFDINLNNINADFVSSSAHKFHGPKGVGFLYINGKNKIDPLIYGGGQERNMRAGTENIYGIAGMAKAMEIAATNMEQIQSHILNLKSSVVKKLKENFEGIQFNGESENKGLYTIINISIPKTDKSEMLIYNLDIEGIAVSGGSACTSGSSVVSHVLKALNKNPNTTTIRLSFSKYNTFEEADHFIDVMKKLIL
jgi:cysteine desulfurase